jgi:arylsulfatase A-like enzyme
MKLFKSKWVNRLEKFLSTVGFYGMFIFAICIHAQETVSESFSKPNIILILADDLGYGDLGITGCKDIMTPNIDKLAENGIFFTQAYVSSPVCSPSRAGLMTGINQVEFGYDNNLAESQEGFDPYFLGLPVGERTVANYLSDLSYVTGLIGKWHLGDAEQFHPLNRGFQEFWGYKGGGHDYLRSEKSGIGYLAPIESNFTEPKPITYLTDDKGDQCVSFIQRHKEKAFFLFAAFNAPHTPMQASEKDLDFFSEIKDEKRRTYAAMVYRLDKNIGKIVKTLQREKLDEKTLIVFLSDNGGPVFSNASLNVPYNGSKGILLEGGIHVPLIMSWPGKLSKGAIYDCPITSLDLTPTFLTIGGFPKKGMPQFTGHNLLPYLFRKEAGKPHDELKWRFTISAAIRKGDWKLVRLPDRLPMLFHLPTDSSEQKNMALSNLEKTQELLQILGDWDVGLPHPLFLEGAEWKERQLELYDRNYKLTH